jgi:predicted ATP-dependent endonuclease of OLD family
MKLNQITIKNFRSIESLSFIIEPINESFTFTLLGINESGKTSFIKAVSLFDNTDISFPQDYNDPTKDVELTLHYQIEQFELKELKESLTELHKFDKTILQELEINEILIKVVYAPASASKTTLEILNFKKAIFTNYTLIEDETTDKIVVSKKSKSDIDQADLNLESFFQDEYDEYFWGLSHKVTLWKASPEYLIQDEIELSSFASDPNRVSIPLSNCFKIADIGNIKSEIIKLTSPESIQNLEDLLSDKITTHINKVWPEHPIKIKFKINSNKLTFLIEDNDVKYKIKTTKQRSDGFRQFISFLLTLSAQNYTQELANSILLLDEPETHLHPSAQLNLKDELIKISQNKSNNIVFFATHSNYMIDKENIDRCYKVEKKKNKTILEKIKKNHTSYSEVNYEVFDIKTSEYHNELYGYLEDVDKAKLMNLPKDRKWTNEKTKKIEDVSLSTYIRHSIHHPENTSNKKYTESELKKSIKILRELKYSEKLVS